MLSVVIAEQIICYCFAGGPLYWRSSRHRCCDGVSFRSGANSICSESSSRQSEYSLFLEMPQIDRDAHTRNDNQNQGQRNWSNMKHVGTTQATVFLRQFLNSFSTAVAAAACIRWTNNSDATNRNQKINIGFQVECVVRGGSSPRKQNFRKGQRGIRKTHGTRNTARTTAKYNRI